MFKLVHSRPRPWVCASCLQRASSQARDHFRASDSGVASGLRWPEQRQRTSQRLRLLSSGSTPRAVAASAFSPNDRQSHRDVSATPADHSSSETHDDSLLRQIFDSPSAWHAFSSRSAKYPTQNAGLFRNAYLKDPEGFLRFANSTLAKARGIVDRVLRASSLEEYKTIVRDLDRLSDLLCRVIDLCDFVRVTHPESRVQEAASAAWYLVYQYMNQLNTMTGLNDQLARAMADPLVTASWSEEEMAVAQILKLDFTKSAVNLPKASRDRFVDISQRISELGSEFVNEMAPEQPRLVLPSSRFQGMDPVMARRFTKGGMVYLPTMSAEAAAALRTVRDENTRKDIFYAMRTASRRSVRLLESLLKSRAELAELAGFESYGHMTLRDRMMAKSPESVQQFLVALAKNNAPLVREEVIRLLEERKRHLNLSSPQDGEAVSLNPWDRDFYANRIREAARSRQKHDDFLSSYFSVGSVMQGLSRLFTRLYGIRFVPRETLPGEKWHPDVRRLDVISDTDGHVAVLYCDLFYRDDKSPNPAHFTVRCSREISEAEVAEEARWLGSDGTERGRDAAASSPHQPWGQNLPQFESPEAAANDGMAVSRSRDRSGNNGVLKQLPTIALVCDFPQRGGGMGSGSKPAFLTFPQLETLFHEMGHAIHSVLARTSFQNVAGTRCATDLAELPSTLMEYFAADPSVLSLFARHYETDEQLDCALVAERLRQSKAFEGSDTENQVLLAMLDQAYHSPLAASSSFDSTSIYHDLQRTHGNVPVDPPTTRWQGFFGHLFGYGSTYYSYLFDQVLAERVWKQVFSSGRRSAETADVPALSRSRGEHLKERLLRWGGSRDPWRCVADALRDERIADGDEKAMALVGSWGTRNRKRG